MLRVSFFICFLFFTNIGLVQAEVVTNFSAEYTIQKDAIVEVTETINYDFEFLDRHGIFRILEKTHPQAPTSWYKTRYVDIKVLSVSMDGKYQPFTVNDSRSELEVKIGDPDRTVSGPHVYKINYELIGALSYGDQGAEFYWNVTGNDWLVPISNATAVVRGEEANILSGENACYQGYFDSTASCSNLDKIGNVVMFTANNLNIGEGLTIATEIDSNAVAFVTTERISYLLFGFLLVTLWLIFAGYKTYRFRTESKIHLPVIAQYEPYENYLPMYSGVLIDGRLDPRDITAGILYLAEQGFIKIKKTEKKVFLFITVDDYEITLLKPVPQMPTVFLQSVSSLMFNYYDTPPRTVMLSSLVQNRGKNSATIFALKNSLKKDITKSGFNTYSWPSFGNWLILAPIVLIALAFIVEYKEFIPLILAFVILPTIVMIIIIVQSRLTRKGYEVRNHLEGFKIFLSVTDKERFNFHNAPEKSPELFMKYLPYAVALGVEEKWAKVFEGITIPQPNWYEGRSMNNFSAISLTKDIGIFSSSFTDISVAPSSSSGVSGSSGRGSSGGGGGGGGGGSW